jgi:fucose 4-O-acetylase-like acetyltransferase
MFLVARTVNETTVSPEPTIVKDRIPWVYHARGLALLLIVYRHIVLGMKFSGVEVSSLMYNLQLVFFNFRMPAFFILSGVFIAKSLKQKSALKVAKDKAGNLLYPYILWASIMVLMQINFHQFTNARRDWGDFLYIVTQPRALDQLWYLVALFNASILYLFLKNVLKHRDEVHISVALLLYVAAFYVEEYSVFRDLFYFYIYLLAGTFLSEWLINAEKRERILNKAYLKWAFLLFVAGQWFWFTHIEQSGLYEVPFLIINFIGCYFLFTVAVVIAQSKKADWLDYIGRCSLYIYILHVQVAAIIRKLVVVAYPAVDPWLLLFICFIGAIVLPIVFINSFKRWGVERLFTLKKGKEA